MSIVGGLHLAFGRINEVKGEALQVFTRNQRQWRSPPLTEETIRLFRERWEKSDFMPVAAHDSYLINLSATDKVVLRKSIAGFAEEINRVGALGIPYLITHPGSHRGLGTDVGLKSYVRNLDRAIGEARPGPVTILIETTAGQGTSLGSTFEEIAYILDYSRCHSRLGVCFDTCHIFAAGYDIRSPQTYQETFTRFHRIIGIERLLFFHLNDSKGSLGSRLDRHAHIGKGRIGRSGFQLLLNDRRFLNHPMVLETPKGKDLRNDIKNLRVLRSLFDG
jgi:deoxyribonuclease-4